MQHVSLSSQRSISHAASGSVLSVTASSDGRMHFKTPLPGKQGVTDIDLPANATVADLLSSVKSADPSVDSATVAAGAVQLASTTPLAFLLTRASTLSMDELDLEIVPTSGSGGLAEALLALRADGGDSAGAYDRLRQRLLQLSKQQAILPFSEYVDLVREVATADVPTSDSPLTPTASLELANHWLSLLHVDGVALHFAHSHDATLRHSLVLQHAAEHMYTARNNNSGGGVATEGVAGGGSFLQAALDLGSAKDTERLRQLCDKAASLEKRVSAMTQTGRQILQRAEKQASALAWGLGASWLAQYGFFCWFIYETSWDFAEPMLYFVGYGYSIIGIMFFLKSQRDPISTNLHETLVAWRRGALHRRLGEAAAAGIDDSAAQKWGKLADFESRLTGSASELDAALREAQVVAQRAGADVQAALKASRETAALGAALPGVSPGGADGPPSPAELANTARA